MRYRSIGTLLAIMLFALNVTAQEQQGSIEGVLTDSTGGVLPGVMVEAKNLNLGTVATSYTDGTGTYRFPALRPGTYDISASLQGFIPAKVPAVTIKLGQLFKVDLTLNVGGMSEEIEVSAAAPIIDTKRSATATSIRDEMINKLPKGRNFTSVVSQAASANDESKLAGISIDGASGAENRYVIDGMDTTSIKTGQSQKNVVTDFIDEVQVKSSGYAAEYGGATGGVINVITKSGGNEWSGSFGSQFRSDNTDGAERPTLRLNPEDIDEAQYVDYPKDNYIRLEPSFALGGPLVTDRAWFFGSYSPDLRTYERTLTFSADDSTASFSERRRTHYATANLHAQLTSKLRGRVAANMSSYSRQGTRPPLDGSGNPAADYDLGLEQPDVSLSGNLDFTATNNLYFGARSGFYTYDTKETGIPAVPWLQCSGSNISQGATGADACVSGNRNVPSNSASQFDKFTRTSVDVDGTYFGRFGGEHSLKAGVQYSRITNEVLSGYQEPRFLFYWGQQVSTTTGERRSGDYGWLRVLQIVTTGDISSNNTGLFVQDSWSVNDKLTLNLGIRTEHELVPSFRTDLGQASDAIDFGFDQKLAPRLGFAYDLKGDGDWKIYGSWGVFYDITKLEMPRGSFGGDQWLDYRYELNRLDWQNFGGDENCHLSAADIAAGRTPSCEGQPFIEVIDFRHPSNDPNDNTIDPNLDPMKSQEFTLGLQHRLNEKTSLGVRYVHKQLDRTIEDVGTLVPGIGEVYYIANPGYGVAEFTVGAECPSCPAQPPATRDYDGVELDFTRRMSSKFSIHASYLWSRLNGNYSGLASSDEDGRSSPNVNRFFDSIVMSFDQNGNPVFGALGTDRPHQFKMQGIYDFDFGTTVGLNMSVASGVPVSRQVDVQSTTPVFYLGRGSEGRTPTFYNADLFLQHEFRFGGRSALQLSLNVLNLFDSDIETTIFNDEINDVIGINNLEEFFFGFDVQREIAAQGTHRDPRFLQASAFQAPRELRFGVKYLF